MQTVYRHRVLACIVMMFATGAAVARTPAGCASTAGRADGVQVILRQASMTDLSLTLAAGQAHTLRPEYIALLTGPCAQAVQGFRVSQIAFSDDAVFDIGQEGQLTYSTRAHGLRRDQGVLLSATHPEIPGARFIMADHVDGSAGRQALEVGVWQSGTDYLVAAYIRRDAGLSVPVELVRAAHPIRSVTYFPAPDTNAGRLGLLQETDTGMAIVSVNWNHTALSRALRNGD
jgi:hypothetical protein